MNWIDLHCPSICEQTIHPFVNSGGVLSAVKPAWSNPSRRGLKRVPRPGEKFLRDHRGLPQHNQDCKGDQRENERLLALPIISKHPTPALTQNICQVEKLMNRLLYNQYKLKKASLLQQATLPQVERTLYHGTSEDSVKEICIHGFNRSFCGKNGTFYYSLCFKSPQAGVHLMTALLCLYSHSLWPRRVLCHQVGPVGEGYVFPAQPGRVQVHFCVQGPDGRLHQRVPHHEDGPAQGDWRHTAAIRQCHGWHQQADDVHHLQRHSGVSRVSHHMPENSPMNGMDFLTRFCFFLNYFLAFFFGWGK